jgi:transposase
MRFALRSAARRYRSLSEEVAELDARLGYLMAQVAADLVALPGVGTDHAATLLLAAGDNSQRLLISAQTPKARILAALCNQG